MTAASKSTGSAEEGSQIAATSAVGAGQAEETVEQVGKANEANEKDLENRPVVKKARKKKRRDVRPVASRLGTFFAALPVELASSISSSLTPIDLLQLARTSKDLRAMLLKSTAKPIWRAAQQTWLDQKMPDLKDYISLPALAALLTDSICHYCGGRRPYKVDWHLLKRICETCRKREILKGREIRKEVEIPDNILGLIPSSEHNSGTNQQSPVTWRRFERCSVRALEVAYTQATQQGAEYFASWRSAQKQYFVRYTADAQAARAWEKERKLVKRTVTRGDEDVRLDEIKARLRDDGWTDADFNAVGQDDGIRAAAKNFKLRLDDTSALFLRAR